MESQRAPALLQRDACCKRWVNKVVFQKSQNRLDNATQLNHSRLTFDVRKATPLCGGPRFAVEGAAEAIDTADRSMPLCSKAGVTQI